MKGCDTSGAEVTLLAIPGSDSHTSFDGSSRCTTARR